MTDSQFARLVNEASLASAGQDNRDAPDQSPSHGANYKAFADANVAGFDLNAQGNKVGSSTCRSLCDSDKTCAGFTFIRDARRNRVAGCWLKSDFPAAGTRSGYISCRKGG